MKKITLLFVLLLFPFFVCADVVEVGGLYYNLFSKGYTKGAEVVKSQSGEKYSGIIQIPTTINYNGENYQVNSIGVEAFLDCKDLKSVNLPNTIITIASSAFKGCTSLKTINIPNSVKSIDKNAFGGCNSLERVDITDLNSWCQITFPPRYYIESNPLFYAHHLFLNDIEITDLNIPTNITTIKSFAFIGCEGIKSVSFHQNVNSIEYSAFSGCKNITSLSIPDGVNFIGNYAFDGCSAVTELRLPRHLNVIGEFTFNACINLQSIIWSPEIHQIDYAAFGDCTKLLNLTLPESIVTIKESAFQNCSNLNTISIGKNIQTIGEKAFGYCENLIDVICEANYVQDIHQDAFLGSHIEYANLYVPEASVSLYKETVPWSYFKNIKALNGDTPVTPQCSTPTISYKNGKLTFNCETEGAEYVSKITNNDIKEYTSSVIKLTATYNISVYATKAGYKNSKEATATLCWIDATPKTEGITDGIANIPAKAALIQSQGGIITIQGIDDGTQVNVYSVNGTQEGSAISSNGEVTISTNLQPGSIAIVKIGAKSVKIVVR